MLGAYTAAQTVPQLKKFLEDGGTILAVGPLGDEPRAAVSSCRSSNHLVERSPTAASRPLPREKYYVPGSILRVAVDTRRRSRTASTNPVDVFFDNSPVFRSSPTRRSKGVRPIAWFDTATPLRSGWAWGQDYLNGGVAIVEAPVGKGSCSCSGPRSRSARSRTGRSSSCSTGFYLGARTPAANATSSTAQR